MKEVAPEETGLDPAVEVLLRCRDNPEVQSLLLLTAHFSDLARLKEPKECWLGVQRETRQLVQE